MAISDWFKSSQKRLNEAAGIEISVFRKNSQLLKDELNMVESLNSAVIHLKKSETGIDGKKELEKFNLIKSALFKVIEEVENIYEKDKKIILSTEYLQQESYKSAYSKAIDIELASKKVALLNKMEVYSIKLVDEVADFVSLNDRLPDAEIRSICESLAKILRDLLESTGDLFTHAKFDPETLQHARAAYQKYIDEFNAEYARTHKTKKTA